MTCSHWRLRSAVKEALLVSGTIDLVDDSRIVAVTIRATTDRQSMIKPELSASHP